MEDNSGLLAHVLIGLGLLALLGGGLGGWAATSEIAGAVVAPGQIVVETNVKKIQHREGGIIGQLFVRDGQHVEADTLLARLDDTLMRANVSIAQNQLMQFTAQRARLEAERDGRADLAPRGHRADRGVSGEFQVMLKAESRLLRARSDMRERQKAQLKEQIAQIGKEIDGLEAQVNSQSEQLRLIEEELEGVRVLWRKKLVAVTRLKGLEREAERLAGERGQLMASIARARNKRSEIELQVLQVDAQHLAEVLAELREAEGKIAELVEREIAAEDQLKRVDIRAPRSGFVHQLAVHTVGGVISPGETLMFIVPEEDGLLVEARVDPQHIDQVMVGQPAFVRFSAFSQKTTPEIRGEIYQVSADAAVDQKTGASFYLARLKVEPHKLPPELERRKLVPGMPAEVFVETDMRTALSYLVKPLTDHFNRSFREE